MSTATAKGMPFVGGYVTDREPWELKPDETPKLQDAVFTGGAAGLRGAWTALPVVAFTGSKEIYLAADNGAAQSFGDLFAIYDNGTALPQTYGGGLGRMFFPGGPSNTATIAPFASIVPSDVTSFAGETVFAYGSASSALARCVVRYAGHTGSLTFTGTGQASVTAGSPVVSFSTSALPALNSFIGISGVNGTAPMFRVIAVDTANNLASVDYPFPFTSTGQAWTQSSVGVVGVGTVVLGMGDATFPATAGNMTGRATKWQVWGGGSWSTPQVGDLVGRRGSWGGGTFVGAAPTGDETMAIYNYMAAASNVAYAVVRPLCGEVVCAHRNRLWAAAPDWAPNLLQWTVADATGVSLSRMFNGLDSPTLDYLDARIADNVDVPDPTAPGKITALCSLPGGSLLALRTIDAYRVSGEPPSISIDQIHPEAGCYMASAACVSDEGAFWAGPGGVWRSTGGMPANLSDDAIGQELRNAPTDRVTIGSVDGHLRVCYLSATSASLNRTYWYDIDGKRWCGLHTGQAAAWQSQRTDGDVLWVPRGATKAATARPVVAASTTTSADDPGGTFIARTPSTRGDGTTTLFRPTQVTAAVEIAGSGGADVMVGSSEVASGAAGSFAGSEGASGEITVKRFGPPASGAGALGRLVRDAYVEVRQQAGAVPSRLRVHQIDIRERQRRVKA